MFLFFFYVYLKHISAREEEREGEGRREGPLLQSRKRLLLIKTWQ